MTESLPPFPFRHRFIPAVHEVVPERFGAPDLRLCTAYAAVVALASNAALDVEGEPYSLQAGRVFVRIRGGEAFEMSPAVDDDMGFSFHAWAGRRHPSGRVEVVDLSTRHFNAWAASSGITVEARFPRAVWGWEDELPKAFRYVADAGVTATVQESFQKKSEEAAAEAAREVLRRLKKGAA